MSDIASPRRKEPPPESDLSQVMAHGPALSAAYGRFWGTVLMLVAITKARRGPLGFGAAASLVLAIFYHTFWK
jgi:hypothetical protein